MQLSSICSYDKKQTGSRGTISSINLRTQLPPLSIKDELNIMKTVTDKQFPMKVYGSAVPEDVAYEAKLNLQEEFEKINKTVFFDEAENKRIRSIIESTHYDDTENFEAISSGANCFTKSLYL
jgi:hypothetical protein